MPINGLVQKDVRLTTLHLCISANNLQLLGDASTFVNKLWMHMIRKDSRRSSNPSIFALYSTPSNFGSLLTTPGCYFS